MGEVTFRNISGRSWYIIQKQMCEWKTGSQCDTASKGRCYQFSTLLAKLVSGRTPRVPTHTHSRGGGNEQELREYSLFAQDVARTEQMPREQQAGYTDYKPLMRFDFDKLSRRRQVIELPKIGMRVDTGDEEGKFYIKTNEIMYQTTHVHNEVPVINPRSLSREKVQFTVLHTLQSVHGRPTLPPIQDRG